MSSCQMGYKGSLSLGETFSITFVPKLHMLKITVLQNIHVELDNDTLGNKLVSDYTHTILSPNICLYIVNYHIKEHMFTSTVSNIHD